MDTEMKRGVVGYTDGGANPNPGPAGAGVHFYQFHYPTSASEKPTAFGRFVVTDKGYFTQKDYEAMKGANKPVQVVVDSYSEIVIPVGEATNNVGEMEAMRVFMANALSLVETDKIEKVHAISDSKLVITGVKEYLNAWAQRNWILSTGKPVANRELWESIAKVKGLLEAVATFTCDWVLGHNDEYGNVRSDLLASLAVNYSAERIVRSSGKHYSNPKDFHKCNLELHPFFCMQRVYFNSVSDQNVDGIYYQTSGGDDKFVFGKRTGDAAYSVIQLNEPDAFASGVIKAACRDDEVNTVLFFRLDRINELPVRQHFQNHGNLAFNKDKRNHSLNFVDKKPVVHEVKPGELPLRSIETLEFLEDMLGIYIDHVNNGAPFKISGTSAEIFDITDVFFDAKTKGKAGAEVEYFELKKEFGVGSEGTVIQREVTLADVTKELKFNLVFGIDLPFRNAMRRLEALHPMVQLVVWKASEGAARFAVILRTDEAVGVWSNYHANLLLI